MKNFIKTATEFLVALGTVVTACSTIYSEYNKSLESKKSKSND